MRDAKTPGPDPLLRRSLAVMRQLGLDENPDIIYTRLIKLCKSFLVLENQLCKPLRGFTSNRDYLLTQ